MWYIYQLKLFRALASYTEFYKTFNFGKIAFQHYITVSTTVYFIEDVFVDNVCFLKSILPLTTGSLINNFQDTYASESLKFCNSPWMRLQVSFGQFQQLSTVHKFSLETCFASFSTIHQFSSFWSIVRPCLYIMKEYGYSYVYVSCSNFPYSMLSARCVSLLIFSFIET